MEHNADQNGRPSRHHAIEACACFKADESEKVVGQEAVRQAGDDEGDAQGVEEHRGRSAPLIARGLAAETDQATVGPA